MIVAFSDEHRQVYGIEPICETIKIAPSTYYAANQREEHPSARSQRDGELRERMRAVTEENWQVYGARKVWAALRRDGVMVAR